MINFTAYASSSAGNFYKIESAGAALLIECGIPIRKIRECLKFDFSNIVGCLLTHSHQDHARAARDIMQAGIDLYCSQGAAKALSLDSHRLNVVKAGNQFSVGGWQVIPFEAQHDAPEPLGFVICAPDGDRILFLTDSYYAKPRFAGLTHMAVECNYSTETINPGIDPVVLKRLWASHMSLENLLEMLAVNDISRVREIHLLHLSDDNSDEQLFIDAIQAATGKPVYAAAGVNL